MLHIDANQVQEKLDLAQLVNALQKGFAADIEVPIRQHYDIPNPQASRETTLLMMPAWQAGQDIGIKLVTVAPDNYQHHLPSIQGTYVLMDAQKGGIKALIDAPTLTAKRTAAASALASRYLSREDSETLLMVGTGTLAPQLIEAHCAVRPIKNILIWGRNKEKAQQIAKRFSYLDKKTQVVEDIPSGAAQADIISVATLSSMPLLQGEWLKPGQHIDLVGAYRPDMREADDTCLLRSQIFVDNRETASKETGDLAIPLKENVINQGDIKADLFALCRNDYRVTRRPQDMTLFKSVGHALEDLVAAQLLTSSPEVQTR